MRRWQLEVTFAEARHHLGVETQRQWSELAIRRATPSLLGLFSLVTLLADRPPAAPSRAIRQAAWYPSASRLSPTPWPPSAATCGSTTFSGHPPRTAMS